MSRLCASAGCFALVLSLFAAGPAAGQGGSWDTVKIPYELIVGNQRNLMRKLRSGEVTVKGAEFESNKEYLKKYARSLVYPVTEKQYYISASEDFRVRPANEDFQNVLNELTSQLLIPTPDNRIDRMQLVQDEYVTQFGVALDEAIGTVLRKPSVPSVVRANTGRLLAEAAKSGAPALGKSIQALLDNTFYTEAGKPADTPPEVLLYALQAAGNLLAAYDIRVQNSPAASRHTLPEDDLMKLIATLQKYATDGPTKELKVYVQSPDGSGQALDLNAKVAAPDPAKKAPAAALLPEQVAVIRYYRRAAIKALANCRFAVVGGRGGAADVRPALALARVCVDDRTLPIPVTPAEALEAVVGLAGMEPNPSLDLPTYALALGTGLRRLAGPKAASLEDTTLPAKIAGMRLTSAFNSLAARSATNPRLRVNQQLFTDLSEIAISDVASRLAGEANAGSAPDFGRLDTYLNNLPPAPKGRVLFTDRPDSILMPRGR